MASNFSGETRVRVSLGTRKNIVLKYFHLKKKIKINIPFNDTFFEMEL